MAKHLQTSRILLKKQLKFKKLLLRTTDFPLIQPVVSSQTLHFRPADKQIIIMKPTPHHAAHVTRQWSVNIDLPSQIIIGDLIKNIPVKGSPVIGVTHGKEEVNDLIVQLIILEQIGRLITHKRLKQQIHDESILI
jgi:hypothetical protein